ncbi:hypothetical protein ACS0TY_033213 [Phlomoides rotata]
MVSSGLFIICMLHSLEALSCGAMMMYYRDGWFVFYLGKEHASLLLGSSPHDQLLIRLRIRFLVCFCLLLVSSCSWWLLCRTESFIVSLLEVVFFSMLHWQF